jgi:rhodanese-related sulfurtransferase
MFKNLLLVLIFSTNFLWAQNNNLYQFINKNITFKNDTIGVSNAKMQSDVLWIDARSYTEYSKGSIANSININAAHPILTELNSVAKNKNIIVVSNFGYRANLLASELKKNGFIQVKVLYGGLIDWVNQQNGLVNDKDATSYLIHIGEKENAVYLTNNNFIAVYFND